MELQKKSELSLGSSSFVVETSLGENAEPTIETKVVSADGNVVYETSQNIASLKPIFQNSQQVSARLRSQHESVLEGLRAGRVAGVPGEAPESTPPPAAVEHESDALAHAVQLLTERSLDEASAALRALLERQPNCNEARELLEVSYKAGSDARLPVDVPLSLKRGMEAFTDGRQRLAIESWKQCLIEEPANRRLQLLVLMSTTWSPERRELYAREVLSEGSESLKAGRPEEVQALLLVAQTVEEGGERPTPEADAPQPGPPAPAAASPAPAAEPESESDSDGELRSVAAEPDAAGELETLVFDDVPLHDEATDGGAPAPTELARDAGEETVAVAPPPAAEEPEPANELESLVDETPPGEETVLVEAAATAPTEIETETETESASESESGPDPALDAKTRPVARRPELESSPGEQSAPRPPGARRRPVGRARRSRPWPLVGGIAAAVLVMGGGLGFWLLSGGAAVPPARLEQASNLVGSGRYPQAIAAYDGLLAEFGDRAVLFLGRGRAKLASGDMDGGISDLERAHEIDPGDPAIAEELADLSYSRGNFPDAIHYYEKAFAQHEGSAESRYRLAVSLVQRDRGDDALPHLQAAIGMEPAHGEAQFLFGQLLNERGRHAEAEKALVAARPHVEAGGDYLAQLAVALLEQTKLDQAEEVARAFIRTYATDARGRSLLGEVYFRREQFEPARAQLIQALRIDPAEPRAQLALGRTWLAIGKSRGDLQDLAKARQVLTTAEGVPEGKRLLALGLVALAEGKLESARSLLTQSLSEGASPLEVRLGLAEASVRSEDLVGAAEELQRAAALAPEDAGIPLSLAIVYAELEQSDRAAEQFLKTLQGIGLLVPPGEDSGPVVLPRPHVPLPDRFDVNRVVRGTYEAVLERSENDLTASELKRLAEPTNFVLTSGP